LSSRFQSNGFFVGGEPAGRKNINNNAVLRYVTNASSNEEKRATATNVKLGANVQITPSCVAGFYLAVGQITSEPNVVQHLHFGVKQLV
jgi:hypothetical protein